MKSVVLRVGNEMLSIDDRVTTNEVDTAPVLDGLFAGFHTKSLDANRLIAAAGIGHDDAALSRDRLIRLIQCDRWSRKTCLLIREGGSGFQNHSLTSVRNCQLLGLARSGAF